MLSIAEAMGKGFFKEAAENYTAYGLDQFCGGQKLAAPMKMRWRHLSFNEKEQCGYGEYSYFQIGMGLRQTHITKKFCAIAYIRIENGKISGWQEMRV